MKNTRIKKHHQSAKCIKHKAVIGETFSTVEHHVYMIVSNDVFQIPQLSLNLMGAVFRSAEISARKRSSYCGLVFLLVCLFACFFFL